MAALRDYLNTPLAEVPSDIRTGQTDAMLNVGFLDVTEPPYNCDQTGVANCTTGFQRALDDGYLYNFTTYVPKGTYLITSLNMYQIADFGNHGGSNRKHAMQLVGDTTDGNYPTLRVAGNLAAGTFINLFFDGDLEFGDARIYNTLLRGFDIDMQNNPNAAAIDFSGAQWCSVEDINIFGEGFRYGFSGLPGSGGSCTNITITGGQTGILQPDYRPTPSVHNVQLINQTDEAVFSTSARGAVILVGFKIEGSGSGYSALRNTATSASGQPQRNWVVVDGSIELSGGATIAVNCVNNTIYMRNVYVKAETIMLQSQSGVALAGNSGQWLRAREYVYVSQQNASPINVDGVDHGSSNSFHNRGLEQISLPPASWQAIHGWDATTFPTWHNSDPIDIRDHGAVQSDTDSPSDQDNRAAIEAALAAGIAASPARPVFVPRGFFYVRSPVNIPAGSVLIGSSFTNSVINSSRHWQPGALTDLVRTADAVGDIVFSDLCFNGHEGSATQGIESHKFITVFHARTSNLLTREMHINRREWFSGGQSHFHAPVVKFTGNAGGRVFNLGLDLFHGSQASMHADHRLLLISGTSNPLAIYQPDCEGCGNSPQAEIVNSENVTWYGFKHEPGEELLDIRDSDNVAILGGSGNYVISAGAMYDIISSQNVVVTVIARQGADMTVPFLRVDGVERVNGTRKQISMVALGNPVPYGEFVEAEPPDGSPLVEPSEQNLSTGTTSSLDAGNLLLITTLGIRNEPASNVSDLEWSAPVTNPFLVNGGGDGRSIGTGFGQVDTGGAKFSTATWQNSAGDAPAIASIIVFEVT